MKYSITTKKFNLAEGEVGHIVNRHIKKINKFFPTLTDDIAEISILIRREHQRKELGRIEINHLNGEEILISTPKISKPYYYSGTIKLILPRKALVVKLYGINLEETINNGFAKLTGEIKRYKAKHFKAESDYLSKESIRKEPFFEAF